MIEKMLERMYFGEPPGGYDRLLDFSTPLTGKTFFAPDAAGPHAGGSETAPLTVRGTSLLVSMAPAIHRSCLAQQRMHGGVTVISAVYVRESGNVPPRPFALTKQL